VIWSGPAIEAIADAVLGRNPVRLVRMHPDIPEMRTLRSLVRVGAETAGDPWRNSVEAYRMLLRISQASADRPAQSRRSSRTVAQIERALQSKPGSAIGKTGLATDLGLSRFQLYRAAKQQLGISPHELAARQRVTKACRLLKTTRRSIAEIAADSGLPDANYFARFFRQRTGFSPRDWRRLFAAP
jgi:AraC-like DNA-binding protein